MWTFPKTQSGHGRRCYVGQYSKEESLIVAGSIPSMFAFVVEGLFSQHYVGPKGDVIIKQFFLENRIATSVSATLLSLPSLFTITAMEDSTVLEYEFAAFKALVAKYPDIAVVTWSGTGLLKRNRARLPFGTTTRCSAIATLQGAGSAQVSGAVLTNWRIQELARHAL